MSNGSVVQRRAGGERKMCEGWIEHKTSSQKSGNPWQNVWFVLKGETIYVFKNQETSQENQLGNLTIDSETVFEKRDRGDSRKGYKFDLKTRRRENKFKTAKSAQREEWRAYIMGLAKGKVPRDIDLLQQDIDRIQKDIDDFKTGGPNRESSYSGPESGIFVDNISGISGYNGSSSGSNGTGSRESKLDSGGPFMICDAFDTNSLDPDQTLSNLASGQDVDCLQTHRFHPDRSDDRVPSWFFAKCPRHTAETILKHIHDYGNTLLRESSTHKDNGSYVISKSFFDRSKGTYEVEHYEVMRVAKGYRINVENAQPEMTCLTAVMDYFVSTTNGSAHPMTTNDMRTLGMQEPDYETRRIRGEPEPDPQPWVWPPPDYDDDRRHRHGPGDVRTVTPGILKKSYSTPETHGHRWSDQPATVAVYPQRESMRSRTNMDDLQHRVQQTATLQVLEDAINTGFQQDMVYVNVPDDIPPPPVPHKPTTPHSYVNEHDGVDPALRELPAAPPPPTYRENRNSTVVVPETKSPEQATPSPSNFQARQRISQPINSTPPAPTQRPGSFIPPPLKKVVSDGSIKNLPKSPGSPASFPTWTDPKQVLKSPKTTQPPVNNINTTVNSANDTCATDVVGVDNTNPGGVSDLKSRFEKSASVQSPTSPQAKSSPGMGKAIRSSPGSLARTRPISDSYVTGHRDNLSALRHSASYSSTNTRNQSVTNNNRRTRASSGGSVVGGGDGNTNSTNNSVRTSFGLEITEDEEDMYDDTAALEIDYPNLLTEKKVAFQESEQPGSNQRRKTEPALSISKNQFEVLQQRHIVQQQSVPAAPVLHQDCPDGQPVPCGVPPPPPPPPPLPNTDRPKWNRHAETSPSCGVNRDLIDDQSDFYRRGTAMAARRGRRQTEPALSPMHNEQASNNDFQDELRRRLAGRIQHSQVQSEEEAEEKLYDEIA